MNDENFQKWHFHSIFTNFALTNYSLKMEFFGYTPFSGRRCCQLPIPHGQPVHSHGRKTSVPSQKSRRQIFKPWLRPRSVLTITVVVALAVTKGKVRLPINNSVKKTAPPMSHTASIFFFRLRNRIGKSCLEDKWKIKSFIMEIRVIIQHL